MSVDDNLQKKLSGMSHSFAALCESAYGLDVPNDFITLAAKAMVHLKGSKRSNVLYIIAKALVKCVKISLIHASQLTGCLWAFKNIWHCSCDMRKVCIIWYSIDHSCNPQ